MRQHRIWFKVLFNPILRRFGWSIVSVFDNNILKGYQLRRYPENCKVVKHGKNEKI